MENRMLTSSSSSDSSDSEEEIPPPIRQPRPNLRSDPFEKFNDQQFKMKFRFTKESVLEILHLISEELEYFSMRNDPIPPLLQLLITLRYYATSTFKTCLGDSFNVSASSICRIIHRVTNAIAGLRPHFIRLPQNKNEMVEVQNKFCEIAGIPNVLGAIDCKHIKVQSPGGEYGEVFRNTKSWFSIKTQAVCDAGLKFVDVVARWPGSANDCTIFYNSIIRTRLEKDEFPGCYLLGDCGYPCKGYLLTPVENPQKRSEQQYNISHEICRKTIEESFDMLRKRFPCLTIGLRVNITRTLSIIVATMILHNIALELHDDVPDQDPDVQTQMLDEPNEHFEGVNQNFEVRDSLINTIFNK